MLSAAPRFFVPELHSVCAGVVREPVRVSLPDDIAHHATRVLRLRPDDPVVLFDGAGGEFHGCLDTAARGGAAVLISAFLPVEREARVGITLVQGLCAQEKTDWLLEKCVEAGVAELIFVATARSVVRLDAERAQRRLTRWRDLAVAACCQCGRNRVPAIRFESDLERALHRDDDAVRWLLSPDADQGLPGTPPGAVVLAVGPEGGFTVDETELARSERYVPTRLGSRVLRTETAGLLGISAALALAGEFS